MAPVKNPIQEELIAKLEEENKELVEEVERTKKDQEELLELLAEQDKRISDYKIQLRQFGVQVKSTLTDWCIKPRLSSVIHSSLFNDSDSIG